MVRITRFRERKTPYMRRCRECGEIRPTEFKMGKVCEDCKARIRERVSRMMIESSVRRKISVNQA